MEVTCEEEGSQQGSAGSRAGLAPLQIPSLKAIVGLWLMARVVTGKAQKEAAFNFAGIDGGGLWAGQGSP